MTGILDRIRSTTVKDLEGVSGDFSDLAPAVYRPRVEREMIRVVEGATDLRDAMPRPSVPNVNAGMVTVDPDLQRRDNRPFKGQPTDKQRALMDRLMDELRGLDVSLWEQGVKYMTDMDSHEAWNPARDENASRWITHLRNKIAELKAAAPVVAAPAPAAGYPKDDAHQDIPNGYYAVADAGPNDIHFFRISRFRDGGIKVQEQASDVLHPVRRGGRRTAILNTIQHVGWRNAAELYGRTIGRCGRCGRTLTDELSRSRGIGPDCWGKL